MIPLNIIVENELCTGCGVCVSECQSAKAKMSWSNTGFLTPSFEQEPSNKDKAAMRLVCPFNSSPAEEIEDEERIADIFLSEAPNYDGKVGRFYSSFVGYAKNFRNTSSSGGLATFIFQQLLEQKIVDHLFVVQEVEGTYQYQLISNEVDVSNFSKTRYIPVTMADLFLKINDLDGKVAVSGVACFIKAIRLKQHYNPDLREKIPFLVGIICGGLKSRFFTDFLVQKAGIYGDYSRQDYRIKDLSSTALDYSFGAFDQQGKHHTIKMKTVGDMWGTGLFKSHACDLCTDVLTELADISLGDAWLDGYREDGAGNSVIVTRSAVAEALIREGLQKELLHLDEVDHTLIVKSQQASYRHRQDGIAFRAKVFKRFGKRLPKLRLMKSKKISLSYAMVQLQRLVVRRNSLKFWEDSPNIIRFDKKMKPSLFVLKVLTKIHHKLK